MRMQEIEIQDYARQLLEAHGDKAVAEAAEKAVPSKSKAKANRPNLEAHRSGSETDAWAARKLKWRPTGDRVAPR